jgi:beta-lactamase regulating signal transducer with metallopeptidase domain
MTPVVLAVLAVVMAWATGPLARSGWVRRAPRLGVLAWHGVVYGLGAAVILAAVTAMVHWDRSHDVLCHAWEVCADALRGAHGGTAQVGAIVGAILLAALLGRLLVGAVTVMTGRRRQRQALEGLVEITAAVVPARGVTVVACPHPAAYLVPGNRAEVVLTTAALERLSGEEIDAVLAHERAHADGRHYWLQASTQVFARAFPRLPAFATAARQIERLLEMRADDVAARTTSRLTLARAMVAMAGPGQPSAPSSLRLDGGDAVERLHRLLDPPAPLPRAAQVLGAVLVTVLPTVPVITALALRSVS